MSNPINPPLCLAVGAVAFASSYDLLGYGPIMVLINLAAAGLVLYGLAGTVAEIVWKVRHVMAKPPRRTEGKLP